MDTIPRIGWVQIWRSTMAESSKTARRNPVSVAFQVMFERAWSPGVLICVAVHKDTILAL